MGLELKPSKTTITHTLHNVGGTKAGFDFLGFNIRQYKAGKYRSGKNTHSVPLGFKTIVKPSKISIQLHYEQLAKFIENNKPLKQKALITRLNAVIRGWCNYYSTVVSKVAFRNLDNLLKWKLWKWVVRRHKRKGRKWLKNKYFHNECYYDNNRDKFINRNWIFSTTKDGEIEHRLILHSDTDIVRHIKVKGNSSPYNGNLLYWSTRMGKNPMMPARKAKLLKTQKGKCNWCNLMFRHGEVMEEDHIIPKAIGGKDNYKNLHLLHRHCHDEKTKNDLKLIKKHQGNKRMEEIYKWFNEQNWIWIDDIPTLV